MSEKDQALIEHREKTANKRKLVKELKEKECKRKRECYLKRKENNRQ